MKISSVLGFAAGALAGAGAVRQMIRMNEARRYRDVARGKRIVILGAGFGGRDAATELARLLPAAGNGEITLVDERHGLLFTPMLTEAVGGDVKAWHITSPVASLPRRIQFRRSVIQSIDLGKKSAVLEGGEVLRADQLLVALGSSTNFHHAQGVEEVAFTVKSLKEADAICGHALEQIDDAEREPDAAKRKEILTFIVAGGGYTGVETMAALNDLVRDEVRRRRGMDVSDLRMLVVEPTKRIMAEVTPDLAAYAQKKLEQRGIEILLNVGIDKATRTAVWLADGREIPCRTLIWAAGVIPSPLVQKADGPKGKHHGLQVDKTLAVPGMPGVWALGDCAEVPENGKTYGATAQNASQQGIHAARNIVRELKGEPLEDFHYTPIGELALVGKRRGVARIYGHNFSGIIAWAMWRGIYLAKMPGFFHKVLIASDWLRDALFVRHYAAQRALQNRTPAGRPAEGDLAAR